MFSSRSALIYLLFTSCFSSVLRWDLRRPQRGSDEAEYIIDYADQAAIQTATRDYTIF